MKSLIGFHSFTGCDTVSVFATKGMVKPLSLLSRDLKFIEVFPFLGPTVVTHSHIVEILEEFVCRIYMELNEWMVKFLM